MKVKNGALCLGQVMPSSEAVGFKKKKKKRPVDITGPASSSSVVEGLVYTCRWYPAYTHCVLLETDNS